MKKVVIDVKQRRPGCVLLQAALGGDSGIVSTFPADSWLLAPTDDMRLIEGTPEQWASFTRELKKRFRR